MSELILIRHGQSLWNLHNRFTGWVDVPLSGKGIQEALDAGDKLAHYSFDMIYVSTLFRAMQTAMTLMSRNASGRVPIIRHDESSGAQMTEWSAIYDESAIRESIPVVRAWQLNERYYGELQGLDKQATIDKYGADQVKIWRRSYDITPPAGESLKLTAERSIPWFRSEIIPLVQSGRNILIAAHGNSLRSIVMFLDGLSEEQVLSLEIATGDPIRYTWSGSELVKRREI